MKCIGDKAEEFALWAFGEGFEELYPLELMNAWNTRYSDKLLLKGDNNMRTDINQMIEIWKKETNQPNH